MYQETIEIDINGEKISFALLDLPTSFLQWQSEARMQMFKMIGKARATKVTMQPAHLPVLATWSQETLASDFPVNLSTRGMGLLPRRDKLEQFVALFQQAKVDAENLPVQETLARRIEVMESFYGEIENFDNQLLGGLEIFEGVTSRNLEINPRAALLYTGEAPKYPSYQFNGIITRVQPGDPCYEFLLAARELFAMDAFHIHQTRYPHGYLFHVVEIKDKTPFPRHPPENILKMREHDEA
ncbi:MAG TPA: hypothetical protein VKM55_20295 [Candidatus Lokiarchaeia archaeon]|nr:hypothetical protein [Candidatus Lokiarchaeia archaeon]